MSPPAPVSAPAGHQLHRCTPFLLAGLLLALAFPCHPRHPLALLFDASWACVALIPLLLALRAGSFKEGFRYGWACGFIFNLLALYWVAHTQGGGAAVVAGTLFMAAYLGLFVGLFAGCLSLLLRRWGPLAGLLAPLLWAGQEYLLSLGELGFPWLLLGHSQAVYPHLIQYAAYTGVYGVSAWVVLVNVLGYLVLSVGLKPGLRLGAVGALLVGFFVPWYYSAGVLAAPPPAEEVRVGVIQPNLGMEKWGLDGLELSFCTLERLSRQAAAAQPELLVWPETSLPCYLTMRPQCRERVERLVAELQVPLLTGAPEQDSLTKEQYNAAFFFLPGQAQLQSCAKMHLVPFGERTPFRDAIPLLRDIDWAVLTGDLGPAEFSPGRERTLFAHPRAPFGVLICFESVFPDLVRRHVQGGARLLVNITNDSWFGQTAGPYQHAQLAVMRAVENRTPVARSATTGVSLFVDPFGRVSQATALFTEEARVGALPIGRGGTFYTRHGDLFAQLALLVSALFLLEAARAASRG
ncbi:MAG: apolipoprotein N-acyltransferase [Candidatus Handelsmanbacteria bacterium]|nr:apolipoprotein N-acyltransferase [Candidatus Handelsmanbacteria bacterium]